MRVAGLAAFAVVASMHWCSVARADEGDDQYAFVVGLCEKKMWDVAAREGERFLDAFPGHAKTTHMRYRLATALFELDRPQEAIPQLDAALATPGFEFEAEAAFRLAQCALAANDLDRADAAITRLSANIKDYLKVPGTFLAGEIAFRRERFDEAQRRYAAVIAADPDGATTKDARYGRAWALFRAKRYDDVDGAAQEFLSKHRGDELAAEIQFLRGEAHLLAKRPQDAADAYRKVDGGPFGDAALRGLGFALDELGDHAGSAAAFGKLLETYRDSKFAAEARLQRGVQCLKANDPKAAVAALAGRTSDPELLYWRGKAQAQAKNAEKALADWDAALRAQPSDELKQRLNVARGDVLFDLGRTQEASEAYASAGNDYALHAAAVASLNAGKHAEAEKNARALLAANPRSPYATRTQLVLGEALFAQKNAAAAIAPLELAAAADEADVRARAKERLGWCFYEVGDKAKARAAFAEIKSEEARLMEARCAEEAGDAAGAFAAWKTFLTEYPQSAQVGTVRYRVAFAAYERKEYAECLREVDALLATNLAPAVAESTRELRVFAARDAGDWGVAREAVLDWAKATTDAARTLATARAVAKGLVDAKRADDAAAMWQAMAQTKPMAAVAGEIQAEVAYAWLDQGRSDEARDAITKALARGASPALAECAFFVGEALFANDDVKGALPLYDAAASKGSPVRDRALYKLGFACLRLEDLANAGKAFALVTRDCKDSALFGECLFLAGEMLYRQDAFADAVTYLARVKTEAPKHEVTPKALFRLGCALTRLGRHAEAEPVLAELAKNYPEFPQLLEAELARGEALAALGNARGAEQAYQRVATQDRGVLSARARIGLGKLRMNAGKPEDALSDFLKVSVLYAHDDEVGESLLLAGECLETMGDRERAGAQYREVVDRFPNSKHAERARSKLARISGV